MAFLPQFIDSTGAVTPQMLELAAIHFVIAMLWQCSLALLITRTLNWLNSSRVQRTLDALTGSFLITLGAGIALER